jgi:type IX secretion system PorP/SprF family membrane protein
MISRKNISTIKFKTSALVIMLSLFSLAAFSQLRPSITQYFFNPYAVNSAFAGKESGLGLNFAYRFNIENRQGGSSTQLLSTDVKLDKSGFGFLFQNDKTGLLSQKSYKFSYAYHFNLSQTTNLNFGLSSNFKQNRFDVNNATINDVDDTFPAQFNSRKAEVDFDFGAALTSDKITVQVSLPNLKQTFSQADKITFNQSLYAAVSYKFNGDNNKFWNLEPILAYSVINDAKNRADLGLRLNLLEDQIGFLALYQSDNSFSGGVNVNLKQGFSILGSYNSTKLISNLASNNTFELAVKTRLFKK